MRAEELVARGRDLRADAEAASGDRVRVHIELGDAHVVLLRGDLLEDRSDHAARPAPGRPEVDQDGRARLEDLLLECAVGDDGGLSHFVIYLAFRLSPISFWVAGKP